MAEKQVRAVAKNDLDSDGWDHADVAEEELMLKSQEKQVGFLDLRENKMVSSDHIEVDTDSTSCGIESGVAERNVNTLVESPPKVEIIDYSHENLSVESSDDGIPPDKESVLEKLDDPARQSLLECIDRVDYVLEQGRSLLDKLCSKSSRQ